MLSILDRLLFISFFTIFLILPRMSALSSGQNINGIVNDQQFMFWTTKKKKIELK